MCVMFLCGNHVRGLSIDEFNRAHEKWMEETLGAAFRAASAATGPRSRFKLSGLAFLRSICKLCFDGHGANEKGNGKEIT